MKPLGFRQANAWLHTWTGLLLGWLLYAVFLTGTLSFPGRNQLLDEARAACLGSGQRQRPARRPQDAGAGPDRRAVEHQPAQ
nr:PepSY domain-containing protein [Stutzerimonas nitrititolerans]